jgi:hypothetical protein
MDAAHAKSDSEFARALGIQPQSIAAARKRQQIPGGWVEDIAEKFNASADWLLFGSMGGTALDSRGRGIPQMESGPKGTALDYRDHKIPQMQNIRQGTAIDARGNRVALEPLVPVVDAVTPEYIECMDCHLAMVPMVEARLSAGTGSFQAGGSTERRYAFRTDFLTRKGQPAQMVLMHVDGDSMEPVICNDDVVLIDQSQTTPRAGRLFAVAVEDVVYIKMVDTLPGKIILKSFNPAYAPLEIDARGDLADGIRIIGRAVWIGRELY